MKINKILMMIMVFIVMTMTANAMTGNGSIDNPWIFEDCSDLLNKSVTTLLDYKAIDTDIDCSVYDRFPGIDSARGHWDGRNHSITGLFIQNETRDATGVGFIHDSPNQYMTMKDLNFPDVVVNVSQFRSSSLIGWANNKINLTNIYLNVTILSASGNFGGLIGEVSGGPFMIKDCIIDYNDRTGMSGTAYGGFIGQGSSTPGIINRSVAHYYGTDEPQGRTGGLCGWCGATGINMTIVDSYADGFLNFSGASTDQNGGLVGFTSQNLVIKRSYSNLTIDFTNAPATGGSIIGGTSSSIRVLEDIFWNNATASRDCVGTSSESGCSGKNDTDMKKNSTFTNYDFSDVWEIDEDVRTPYLQHEIPPSLTIDGSGTAGDPYNITSCLQLHNLASLTDITAGNHYILGNDIDCQASSGYSAYGYKPIGNNSKDFEGYFNGRFFTIHNITIARDKTTDLDKNDYNGLFGRTLNSVIRNVYLKDFNITGYERHGAVSGASTNETIINVSSERLICNVHRWCGGISGNGNGYIDRCRAINQTITTNFQGGTFVASTSYYVNNSYSQDWTLIGGGGSNYRFARALNTVEDSMRLSGSGGISTDVITSTNPAITSYRVGGGNYFTSATETDLKNISFLEDDWDVTDIWYHVDESYPELRWILGLGPANKTAPVMGNITFPDADDQIFNGFLTFVWDPATDIDDDLNHYEVTIFNWTDLVYENRTITATSHTINTSQINDGFHTFNVWAVDDHDLNDSEHINFYIDNTPPILSIQVPTGVYGYQELNGTMTETNPDSIWISNDSFTLVSSYPDFRFTYDPDISFFGNITITGNDSVGQTGSITRYVKYDVVLPQCSGVGSREFVQNESFNWVINCSDDDLIRSFNLSCEGGSSFAFFEENISTPGYAFENETGPLSAETTCTFLVTDWSNQTRSYVQRFAVDERPTYFDFDLTKLANVIILATLVFLWLGLMIIGMVFKNFGFLTFGFFIGIFIGLILSGVHMFLTLVFFFMNISLWFGGAKAMKD